MGHTIPKNTTRNTVVGGGRRRTGSFWWTLLLQEVYPICSSHFIMFVFGLDLNSTLYMFAYKTATAEEILFWRCTELVAR